MPICSPTGFRALFFSRGLKPDKEFLAATEKAGVPVFQSPMVTMKFINKRPRWSWESMLPRAAPEIGSMVDILGVGVIIRAKRHR